MPARPAPTPALPTRRPRQALRRSLIAAALAACGSDPRASTDPAPAEIRGVTLAPRSAEIATGDTLRLSAAIAADAGASTALTWSSADPSIATVSGSGTIAGVSPGATIVRVVASARSTVRDSVTVRVIGRVRRVRIMPPTPSLLELTSVQLTAEVDADAGVSRDVLWSAGDTAVAAVSPTGLLSARRPGRTIVRIVAAAAAGVRDSVTLTVAERPVAAIVLTPAESALVIDSTLALAATVRDAAGTVLSGRVPTWTSSRPDVATVGATGVVRAIAVGSATISARVGDVTGTATIRVTRPALRFRQVVAGTLHSCGLTSDGAAYCWGSGQNGRLGYGGTDFQEVPRAVAGGHAFVRLSAGSQHTCGVRADGAALCWGFNVDGRIGDGSSESRLEPTRVAASPAFTHVVAGGEHACAVATGGAIYCWGNGGNWKLGTGSQLSSRTPALVQGGHTYRQVVLGDSHTCGLRTDGVAVCWGYGQAWRNGRFADAETPTPVDQPNGVAFAELTAGDFVTCGRTAVGVTYCWGPSGSDGRIGDGFEQARPVPTLVAGDHRFGALAGGGSHGCALTLTGTAFCWGENRFGQLGSGVSAARWTPTIVNGALAFSGIAAGGSHSCAWTANGTTYCWGSNNSGQLGLGSRTGAFGSPALVAPPAP